jgi:hypothetical protein
MSKQSIQNIDYLISKHGYALCKVPHPSHLQCKIALSNYPMALEWVPAEFQTLFPDIVDSAIKDAPTAIVFDRRPKSIIKTVKDLLQEYEIADDDNCLIIVRHIMIRILSAEGLEQCVKHAEFRRFVIDKLCEFYDTSRLRPLHSMLRVTLQKIDAAVTVLPIPENPEIVLNTYAIQTIPGPRRSARIASRA